MHEPGAVQSGADRKMLQLPFILQLYGLGLLALRLEASHPHVGSCKLRSRRFQLRSAREKL